MHTHGTAVLDGPAEATPVQKTGTSARDQWLAKCTDDAAKALATGNADLLPVLPALVFFPQPDLCPDCHGTGYTWMDHEFTLCYCGDGAAPAYDFPRYGTGEVISVIGMSRRNRDGEADVWTPCHDCNIGPIKHSPYNPHNDDLIQVPWVPDCATCNDTGWAFSHHIPAQDACFW